MVCLLLADGYQRVALYLNALNTDIHCLVCSLSLLISCRSPNILVILY